MYDADDGTSADKLELSYQLLHAGWFLTAYSASSAKTKSQRAVAMRSISFRDSITREVFFDSDPVSSIAAAIFSEEPTDAELDALRDLVAEFKAYVDAEPVICSTLFGAAGVVDQFQHAYRRTAVHGRFWSQNLNLFRGAAFLLPTKTVPARNTTVDFLADDLRDSAPSDVHAVIEDTSLMQQLAPSGLGEQKGIVFEWCARATHPLMPHEIFWISHDDTANKRMRAVYVGLLRGFGLVPTGTLNVFEQMPLESDQEAAWQWMSTSTAFFPALVNIVNTLLALNRRQFYLGILRALIAIPCWAKMFADDLEREILPALKDKDRPDIEDLIAAATADDDAA